LALARVADAGRETPRQSPRSLLGSGGGSLDSGGADHPAGLCLAAAVSLSKPDGLSLSDLRRDPRGHRSGAAPSSVGVGIQSPRHTELRRVSWRRPDRGNRRAGRAAASRAQAIFPRSAGGSVVSRGAQLDLGARSLSSGIAENPELLNPEAKAGAA